MSGAGEERGEDWKEKRKKKKKRKKKGAAESGGDDGFDRGPQVALGLYRSAPEPGRRHRVPA